jgi:hypothetical protein
MTRNPNSRLHATLAVTLAAVLAALPVSGANSIAVTQAAKLGPTTSLWGLEVTLQDVAPRNATYVYVGPSKGFNNETTLRGSFFIDPQGVTFGTAPGAFSFQMITFLDNTSPTGHVHLIFHLRQDTSNGNYFLNVWHWNQTLNSGNGNWQFSGGGFFALKNAAWHNTRLDFSWNAGNPGHMVMWRTLYTNGLPDASGTLQIFSADLPGMQDAVINYVFAGMFGSHDPGTFGVLNLDGFSFSR